MMVMMVNVVTVIVIDCDDECSPLCDAVVVVVCVLMTILLQCRTAATMLSLVAVSGSGPGSSRPDSSYSKTLTTSLLSKMIEKEMLPHKLTKSRKRFVSGSGSGSE